MWQLDSKPADWDFSCTLLQYGYWLDFEHGNTGKVEYRVWWPGSSPLSLDRVVLFRKP